MKVERNGVTIEMVNAGIIIGDRRINDNIPFYVNLGQTEIALLKQFLEGLPDE